MILEMQLLPSVLQELLLINLRGKVNLLLLLWVITSVLLDVRPFVRKLLNVWLKEKKNIIE